MWGGGSTIDHDVNEFKSETLLKNEKICAVFDNGNHQKGTPSQGTPSPSLNMWRGTLLHLRWAGYIYRTMHNIILQAPIIKFHEYYKAGRRRVIGFMEHGFYEKLKLSNVQPG